MEIPSGDPLRRSPQEIPSGEPLLAPSGDTLVTPSGEFLMTPLRRSFENFLKPPQESHHFKFLLDLFKFMVHRKAEWRSGLRRQVGMVR